jgi:hemerythrin
MDRPLPWSEAFAVGHAVLDAQHRRLVELINDVGAAVRSKMNPERLVELLKMLRVAVEEHIRQEDALLWELKSGTYEPMKDRLRTTYFLEAMAEAAFDEHMAEHKTLLTRFNAIVSAPVDTLCELLKAWFLDHAIKHDAHLRAIFQAM